MVMVPPAERSALPKVIDGEVIAERTTTVPPPVPPPAPHRGRGRVRWYWWLLVAVVGVLTLCVGVPVGVASIWFVHGTIEAGKAWPVPDGALNAFVDSFDDDSHDGADDGGTGVRVGS